MEQWMTGEFWSAMLQQFVQWLVTSIPSIIVIIVLAVVALKAAGWLLGKARGMMLARMKKNNSIDPDEQEKRVNTLVRILNAAVRTLLWAVILMALLKKVGVDIAPLIAGAGIIGLAFGFGAQELVRDVISGFFILLENHVRTGDVAIINGTAGLVEDIGLRAILLRDLSGTVHVFQNGKINSLSNMTKDWSAVVFDMEVAYKEDTDEVARVMLEVAEDMQNDPEYGPFIIEPMEMMGVDSFGDSAVVVKARLKTRPVKQWYVGREYRRRLKKAFDERGIEIPFPHRTIYWGEEIAPLKLKVEKQNSEKASG
ncbi:MAG: mechanosensitive ion channel family protein [Deltaproteobacteria bacterium]|nr:mechanosensitive ion channel family protein [Deltaproteobacteria bacterium]